tara:strand:+ start:861 stop:1532 length:672 start_codon:yes stop_codon:yes gene_type:complete
MLVAFWSPLLYVLVQGSAKEWSEGLEAFSELVDEVTSERTRKSWFPRIEGRWRGRGATLRVALGGGWIFGLETKATTLPTADPSEGGSSPSWTELTSIREELAEWRNRGTLRIKGGRLEAWFPQEAQFDAKRLQRAAPLVARAAELLDRIAGLEGQSDRIRCPYCHDLLQSGGPGGTAPEALSTCEGCHTAHHEACYAEAGCTILGCSHFGQRQGPQGEPQSA